MAEPKNKNKINRLLILSDKLNNTNNKPTTEEIDEFFKLEKEVKQTVNEYQKLKQTLEIATQTLEQYKTDYEYVHSELKKSYEKTKTILEENQTLKNNIEITDTLNRKYVKEKQKLKEDAEKYRKYIKDLQDASGKSLTLEECDNLIKEIGQNKIDSQKYKKLVELIKKLNLSLISNGLRCIANIERQEGNKELSDKYYEIESQIHTLQSLLDEAKK